jgi:hypothetical protein
MVSASFTTSCFDRTPPPANIDRNNNSTHRPSRLALAVPRGISASSSAGSSHRYACVLSKPDGIVNSIEPRAWNPNEGNARCAINYTIEAAGASSLHRTASVGACLCQSCQRHENAQRHRTTSCHGRRETIPMTRKLRPQCFSCAASNDSDGVLLSTCLLLVMHNQQQN